jgi:hypothetical protein
MNFAWLKNPPAWQPFTFRGVAAFARASFTRLFVVQFIIALLAASTVVWFLNTRWFPTAYQAIQQMPETGEIRNGKLTWTNDVPQLLAEGHYLAFISDLDHKGEIRAPAQVQIEFGRTSLRIISLLGYVDWPYPSEAKWIFICNRNDLQPWWGAWRPPMLWITFGSVVFGLIIVWGTLASIYFIPVWLIGFFANRRLTVFGSWRLAGAALMPGAVMVILSLILYGFGVFDLVQMLAIQGGHVIVGWVYCVGAALREPELPEAAALKENPFPPPADESRSSTFSEEKEEENPFKKPEA